MDGGVNGSGAQPDSQSRRSASPAKRSRRRVLAVSAGAVVMLTAVLWSQRGDIADHAIGTVLRQQGIPAHWRIVSIGLDRQILVDVVVGDPAHPDLTIDRVITTAGLQGWTPGLSRVTLVNPRLYGAWRGGKLSFGSLDKLLFAPPKTPFRLPDLALTIANGSGEIVGDAGVIGLGLTGEGPLRQGFVGSLAAVSGHLDLAGCGVDDVKLTAHVGIADERPRLSGPLRLANLTCAARGVRIGTAILPLELRARPSLAGWDGTAQWRATALALGSTTAAAATGTADLTLRDGAVTARYTAVLGGLAAEDVSAATLGGNGMLRADTGFAHVTAEGTLNGAGLTLGSAAWRGLEQARRASAETLAAPLLGQIEQVLRRETPHSRLSGRYVLHRAAGALALIVPEARLIGGSGASLLAVTRAGIADGGSGLRLSGHFVTLGDLPRIAGHAEHGADGRDRVQLSMARYRAGTAEIEVPGLAVTLAGNTAGLAGNAVLSGALPGGFAENLRLPIVGMWASRRGWALWPGCTHIDFTRLTIATLTLRRDALTLCPRPGGAILALGPAGASMAAGAPSFDLSGQLAGSPIRLAGGPVGFAIKPGQPGTLFGRTLQVTLGEGQAGTSRFAVDRFDARLGATIGGHFSGSDLALAAVPLNLRDIAGNWTYADGVLGIADAALQMADRETPPRFAPLVATGARLSLVRGVITADALLRVPKDQRPIVRVAIRHDLGTGKGHADLAVAGVNFDKGLQPEALSALTLGIIADARGTVTGQGAIDWAGGNVTSHGRVGTDSLDFAAAFGPVKGLSGTVTFTDLLGLVSAPDQQVRIAAINPGIEVDDGLATFALLPGHVLAVHGAQWPFLDGRLRLLPTRMTLGAAEVRRYEMQVEGVDAAKFLVRMNLSNLSATGLFDGSLPLVFDQTGGRVVGGMLASRPPGGSVSYVGALSYKDLSPMANFAFETLKSLNYTQLSIGLDGSLAGDIFTRVSMRGVTQGPGAKRNFLTKQVGRLPLQFNVNIHAPFFMMVNNFRSIYDSSYLADPRTLGLLGADGKPIVKPAVPATPAAPIIQPPVSETKP